MNKTIIKISIKLVFIFIFFCSCSMQSCFAHCDRPKYPAPKEQDKIDKMLETRLNLTTEQINYLKKVKPKNRKEIENAIKKMELKRDEIRNVYLLGLPRFQTDIRTAPLKAELVILKQNADKLKENHRKDFENILTLEQKLEFEKIKKELAIKKMQPQK